VTLLHITGTLFCVYRMNSAAFDSAECAPDGLAARDVLFTNVTRISPTHCQKL
jgi:hypothetical protein